jgi:hypothetical protein
MKSVVLAVAAIATPERAEVLARVAFLLWLGATCAFLIASAIAFATSLMNPDSVESADEMARAGIFLASCAGVYVAGRAAQHVISGD